MPFHSVVQFSDMLADLSDWLNEAEEALKGDPGISNEPDKIRHQLIKHRDFQKVCTGKHLKDVYI